MDAPWKKAVSRLNSDALVTQLPSNSLIIVVALFSFIYANDKRLGDTTKDYADLMLNSAVSIEIHDSQSDKLIAKYGDKSSIDKVNAILDIENWEKVENIDKNINPIYTLELYYDTTKRIIVYIEANVTMRSRMRESRTYGSVRG